MNISLLPKSRQGYFEWNGSEGKQREWYTILGFAVADLPKEVAQNSVSGIYRHTLMLVERRDGKVTWLNIDQITLEPEYVSE